MGDIVDFQSHKRKKKNKKYKGCSSKKHGNVYAVIAIILVLFLVLVYNLKNYVRLPATYTLIGTNAIVFFLICSKKLFYYDLGTSYDSTIGKGEYYRIITSAFTHQEVWHILINMYSLDNLGRALEPLIGTYRFIFYYALIMLTEGYIATKIHKNRSRNIYSIGASGVLCGLMGIYLVIAFSFMGLEGIRGSLPSIVCLILMTFSKRIDSIAHFTGLGVGIVCGIVMLV